MRSEGLVSWPDRRWRSVRLVGRPEQLAPGPDQDDPAVVAAEAPPPDPGDLSESTQLVEQARLVAGDPCRQDVPLEDRGGDRVAGELIHDLGEPLERGGAAQGRGRRPRRSDPVPFRQEPGQCRRVDGLDLPPEPGQ